MSKQSFHKEDNIEPNKQSLSKEDQIKAEIQKITFTRNSLENIIMRKNFSEIVTNGFVRVMITSAKESKYVLCQINEVIEAKE